MPVAEKLFLMRQKPLLQAAETGFVFDVEGPGATQVLAKIALSTLRCQTLNPLTCQCFFSCKKNKPHCNLNRVRPARDANRSLRLSRCSTITVVSYKDPVCKLFRSSAVSLWQTSNSSPVVPTFNSLTRLWGRCPETHNGV